MPAPGDPDPSGRHPADARAAPRLSDAEMLARFAASRRRPPCSETLGLEVTAIDQAAGTVRMTMRGRPEWCNPTGALQGGFVVALLDEAMAVAGIVAGQMDYLVPTLELKTSFLRPCPVGQVTAEGRLVRWGRRAAFLEADLYDPQGRLVARATSTVVPTPVEGRATRT